VTRAPVIAIDGPSGSGKGTVGRRVAAALGWHVLDSGALYRLAGLAGARAGLAPGDEAGHARIAGAMDIRFGAGRDGEQTVLLGGEDVTAAIRSETAGNRASQVAGFPTVRAALAGRQRQFARPPGLVADGRDMGSVIFPDAVLKVFLTASAVERAQRRLKQLRGQGIEVDLAVLTREIAERDHRDTTRSVAPLIAAPGAVVLDSTGLKPEAVVERILELARQRGVGA
jgi:cytidylate kinase